MSEPNEKLLNENEKKDEQVEQLFTKSETNEVNTFEPNGDISVLETTIEEERKKLKDFYKKSKRTSNISVLIAVALIIACFVLVSQADTALKIIGYCLGGAALIGMLVFYVLTKNKFPSATREYINVVETRYNAFAFHNEKYVELTFDKNDKIEKGDIASDYVYKDISRLSSRNVIRAKFDGQHLLVSDLAVYHKGPKSQDLPVFVGKYISLENNVAFDGRIILCTKNAEKPVDLPDYLEDVELVKEDENFVIYTSKGVDYKEVLGTKLISEIKNIKIENHLLNVNVVVWGGHTAAYLSFDDETMVFPFEKEFKAEPYVQYEKVQTSLLNSLSALNKHKEVKSLKVEQEIESVNAQEEMSE